MEGTHTFQWFCLQHSLGLSDLDRYTGIYERALADGLVFLGTQRRDEPGCLFL